MAENSGKMDIVTFDEPKMQNAVIKTIKDRLESTPGVIATTQNGVDRRREAKLHG